MVRNNGRLQLPECCVSEGKIMTVTTVGHVQIVVGPPESEMRFYATALKEGDADTIDAEFLVWADGMHRDVVVRCTAVALPEDGNQKISVLGTMDGLRVECYFYPHGGGSIQFLG